MAKTKKINIKLSSNSVRSAIQELKQYRNSLVYKCQRFAERLAEEGVFIARVKIAEYNAIDTADLLSSVKSEYGGVSKDGATYRVVTDCPSAPFVEFGFGVIGEASPHPISNGTWEYVVNEAHRNGWWYFNEQKGKLMFSKGQPSKPFMYETARDLSLIVQKVAKEVFG